MIAWGVIMNTLKAQVEAELGRLGAVLTTPDPITCTAGGNRLECELVELDRLACAFSYLGVENAALAKAGMEQLKEVAEDLARRLTYLLEPISPIEVDADQCVVQMRSNPPQKDESGTTYYELLVKQGGLLALARYTRERGTQRRPIPAHVTREVFLRLVDDFARAAV